MNSIQIKNELMGLKNFYEFSYYDKKKLFQIDSLLLDLEIKLMNYSENLLIERNSQRLNYLQSVINNLKESYE